MTSIICRVGRVPVPSFSSGSSRAVVFTSSSSSSSSSLSSPLSSSSLSSSLSSSSSSSGFYSLPLLLRYHYCTQSSLKSIRPTTATSNSNSNSNSTSSIPSTVSISSIPSTSTSSKVPISSSTSDSRLLDTALYNNHLAIELRENCRCEECCLTATKQRKGTMKINPKVTVLSMYEKDQTLYVTWSDGHTGFIPLSDIDSSVVMPDINNNNNNNRVSLNNNNNNNNNKLKRTIPRYSEKVCPLDEYYLWEGNNIEKERNQFEFSFNDIMKDEKALLHMIQALEKYGLVRLQDSFGHIGAAEIVGKRIGLIRSTIYGDSFVVTSNREMITVQSQAYTNEDVPPHTDLSYYELSPDIIVSHCIENGIIGGESYYVDGFQVVKELRDKFPTYFEILTTTKVPFRKNFMDKGFDMISNHCIIELDWEDMSIIRIHFDEGNRQSLNWDLPIQRKREFYDALRKFREMLFDEKKRYEFRMHCGEMTIFDNRRILHAWKAFRGKRVIEGCYLDWQSIHANYLSQSAKIPTLNTTTTTTKSK